MCIAHRTAGHRPTRSVFEDFDGRLRRLAVTGDAFGERPTRAGDSGSTSRRDRPASTRVGPGQAHSGLVSDRLQGVLRSRTFTIEKRYIHYLVAGRGGTINVVVDGFEKIRDPIYGGLTTAVNVGDQPRWITQDVGMWMGHAAYIELADGAVADYQRGHDPDAMTATATSPSTRSGCPIIRLPRPLPAADGASGGPGRSCTRRGDSHLTSPSSPAGSDGAIDRCRASRRRSPSRGWRWRSPTAAGWTSTSTSGAITGTWANSCPAGSSRSSAAPDVHASLGQRPPGAGPAMVDPQANPLTPRVLVNRLWKHHFGEGIVRVDRRLRRDGPRRPAIRNCSTGWRRGSSPAAGRSRPSSG